MHAARALPPSALAQIAYVDPRDMTRAWHVIRFDLIGIVVIDALASLGSIYLTTWPVITPFPSTPPPSFFFLV